MISLIIQGVFFNWCPPKIHKYGKKLKYQNWCPPKNSKYQPVRKFWHLGLLWWDLLCNLTLRTFWGGTSWDLEIIGGHQFESSKHFTYRKTLTTFRGAPVKKNTLYENLFIFYSKVTCICQYGPPLGWNYSQDIIILNGDIICWQLFAPVFVKNHVLSRFTQFLWTIEKPLIPMMRRKTIHSMAMVQQ